MSMTNVAFRPLKWESNSDQTVYKTKVCVTSTVEGKSLSIPIIKFAIEKFNSEVYFLEYTLGYNKSSCSYGSIAAAMQAAQQFCYEFIANSDISCSTFDKTELLEPEEYSYFQVKHTIYPRTKDNNKINKTYLYTDMNDAIKKAKKLRATVKPKEVVSIFISCNEDCAWVNPDGAISTRVGLSWK